VKPEPRKRIAILGSTGSIGQSALAVVDAHPARLRVVGLAAGENADLLAAQMLKYRPAIAAMSTGAAIDRLKAMSVNDGATIAGTGRDGLVAVATHPDVDLVLCASSGTDALEAVLAAIDHGKAIALANKEVLVMAGGIVTEAAARKGVAILPVDSEHNAIHQCLHGRASSEIRRLILTASGGPFRGRTAAELSGVTADDALKHPTWRMGRKITIDSATLMNKGLEVIEARWLFDLAPDQVQVVIHPQSIVHSMVEYIDGSIMAQLSTTDMKFPIQYALLYPERVTAPFARLDLAKIRTLEFAPVDPQRFPAVKLAYEACRAGGSMPAVLNAANEVAVERFLAGELSFTSIVEVVSRVIDKHARNVTAIKTLDDALHWDGWARNEARGIDVAVQRR
jgi:1-deoxy-D-xylulose-5-phosphate reductoisomerase